jgi:hypothetical protein
MIVQTARLSDLQAGWDAYHRYHGPPPATTSPVRAAFLHDMMQQFPDMTKDTAHDT